MTTWGTIIRQIIISSCRKVYADIGRNTFSTPTYFDFRLYYQGIGGVMKAFCDHEWSNQSPRQISRRRIHASAVSAPRRRSRRMAGVTASFRDGPIRRRRPPAGPRFCTPINATNLAEELYNSSQLPARDNPGNAVKMSVPDHCGRQGVCRRARGRGHFWQRYIFLPARFSLRPGGDFNNSVTVTLLDAEPDVDIYYTLDGAEPTIHSPHYRTPITVTNSATLRALAVKPGAVSSAVTSSFALSTRRRSVVAPDFHRSILGQCQRIRFHE